MGDSRPGRMTWFPGCEAANKIAVRPRRREAESKDHRNLDNGRYRKCSSPGAIIGIIGAPEGERSEHPGSDQKISSTEGRQCTAADGRQRAMRYEIAQRIQVAQLAGIERDQILAQEYRHRPARIGRSPNPAFECK